MVTLDLFCRTLLLITAATHLRRHQNERLRGDTCFYELLALGLLALMHPQHSTSRGPHATCKLQELWCGELFHERGRIRGWYQHARCREQKGEMAVKFGCQGWKTRACFSVNESSHGQIVFEKTFLICLFTYKNTIQDKSHPHRPRDWCNLVDGPPPPPLLQPPPPRCSASAGHRRGSAGWRWPSGGSTRWGWPLEVEGGGWTGRGPSGARGSLQNNGSRRRRS